MSHKILVALDPVLVRTLDAMARERWQPRAELLRDMIYTAVWHAKRDGLNRLERAPLKPPNYTDWQSDLRTIRVMSDSYKLVKIDAFGLAIDPPSIIGPTDPIPTQSNATDGLI